MLQGIDLSNYQALTPEGLDFYIIKASEGNGYQDARLNQHYNAVKAMGKKYGFYHYARPDLGNSPQAEAEWFLSLVGQHAGKCIFALDWEGESLNYPCSWALEWLEYVYQKTGVRPLFYCSTGFLNGGKYAEIAGHNFGLWLAQYASAPTLEETSGWNTWAIWQYGDSAPIDGVGYDGDLFNGDTNTWDLYCGQSEKTPPKEAPKANEERKKLTQHEKGSVYRLYNPKTGVHYLTENFTVAKDFYEHGWNFEEIAFMASHDQPVYSVMASGQSDYIYTTSLEAIKDLEANGWKNTGMAFRAGGNYPCYRLFNSKAKSGAHLFSANLKEVNTLIKMGWTLEGVPFMVRAVN